MLEKYSLALSATFISFRNTFYGRIFLISAVFFCYFFSFYFPYTVNFPTSLQKGKQYCMFIFFKWCYCVSSLMLLPKSEERSMSMCQFSDYSKKNTKKGVILKSFDVFPWIFWIRLLHIVHMATPLRKCQHRHHKMLLMLHILLRYSTCI